MLINNWAFFLSFPLGFIKNYFFHEKEGNKKKLKLQWKMCNFSTAGEKLTAQTGYLKWLRTGLHLCPLGEGLIIYLAGLSLTWTSLDGHKRNPRLLDRPFINTKVVISNKWSILKQRTAITFTRNVMFRPWPA